jgi:hypothetical protein
MLKHLALSFLVASGVLAASQLEETLRPPDLNQLSKEQFQQLFSKAFNGSNKLVHVPNLVLETRNRRCSIPLLESRVEHPERFSMPKLPVGRRNLDPMSVAPPAPVCRGWNQGK